MLPKLLAISLLASPLAAVAAAAGDDGTGSERVLGAFLFHRHGDRTAKAWKPVTLTALGAQQVYQSGAFYRSRYLSSGSDSGSGSGADANRSRIAGLSSDTAVLSQLDVTSPRDAVLHSSALAFLQGLYPPTSDAASALANGTRVVAPLGGYQFVPVEPVGSVSDKDRPEDNAWLQGGSGCADAEKSSSSYLFSADYRRDYDGSLDFYRSLLPVINGTYGEKEANFKNGYSIFDLVNVASIHNSSMSSSSSSLLTPEVRARLYNLASVHEWNLAFNSSEPVRAIAGASLAGEILESLQALIDGKPKKLYAQFGAYGTFMAFFGLAQLPAASPDFFGICNYASSMAFELVTSVPDAKPRPEDINVRFLFANGTASENTLKAFPLFGQSKKMLSWADFKAGMSDFAIRDTKHWCDLCGNKGEKCASKATSTSGDASSKGNNGNNGISRPVAGVIGALVTLVAILGVQAAVVLLGGLRLVKKSSLVQANQGDLGSGVGAAKA